MLKQYCHSRKSEHTVYMYSWHDENLNTRSGTGDDAVHRFKAERASAMPSELLNCLLHVHAEA